MLKNGGKYSIVMRFRATKHRRRRGILQEEYKRIESLLKLRNPLTLPLCPLCGYVQYFLISSLNNVEVMNQSSERIKLTVKGDIVLNFS